MNLNSVSENDKVFRPVSVVIPTYRREQVLIDTLQYLLALPSPPAEILVLDQTEQHEAATNQQLTALHAKGDIRWIRLAEPSIPKAMNQGLLLASNELVLFVDDDIRPEPELLSAHLEVHALKPGVLVAGRVIQPWQEGQDFTNAQTFHFATKKACWVDEFIGCNFSFERSMAIKVGGFDEQFVKVAYRYEAEFSYRWLDAGKRIYFEPSACLHHLKDSGGGTRSYGEHLTTSRPDHAVGDYYYLLKTRQWLRFLQRPFRSVATRHHLFHPWGIFTTLLAECRGILWALKLHRAGPRLISGPDVDRRHA